MNALFDKTQIKGMTLKNRFIRSATWENMATREGGLSERLLNVYEELAQGGVGLIISGTVYFSPSISGHIVLASDNAIREYQRLANVVHQHDCKILLQVNHADHSERSPLPAALSHEQIRAIITEFGNVAARAEQAGFDGVQLHAAHGFFLSRFIHPLVNRRTDEYGGSLEKNLRVLSEIYDEIRRRTRPSFQIFMKINCIDGSSPALVFDACRYTCRHFAEKQMDAIEISGNVFDFPDSRINPYRESVLRDYAAQIADDVDIPIILVGVNRSCATMTEILNTTKIRYFSLSRPLIREPNLINLWRDDPAYIPQCLSCTQCFRPDGNTCIFET